MVFGGQRAGLVLQELTRAGVGGECSPRRLALLPGKQAGTGVWAQAGTQVGA